MTRSFCLWVPSRIVPAKVSRMLIISPMPAFCGGVAGPVGIADTMAREMRGAAGDFNSMSVVLLDRIFSAALIFSCAVS